jgi:hypothetical protein
VPVIPPVTTAVAMPAAMSHNHGVAVVAVLPEEDELAVVSVWQSHERCCCLHLPYLAGWYGDRDAFGNPGCLFFSSAGGGGCLFSSLAGGDGSFFSSSGGGAAKMALTVPVSRSFLS